MVGSRGRGGPPTAGRGGGGRGGAAEGRGVRNQLMHYQKLDRELKEIHAKAARMDRGNMSMKQKRDHDWKVFENLGGGKRPQQRQSYKEHLRRTKKRTDLDRQDMRKENRTGEYDLIKGSMKDKFRKKALEQRHGVEKKLKMQAKKMGNPHVLFQAGKFDFHTNTLTLNSKVPRKIEREGKFGKDVGDKKNRSDWRDSYDINRPGNRRRVDDCNDLRV
eukprot:PhM_4_TR48/c0_g1_i1/m.98513